MRVALAQIIMLCAIAIYCNIRDPFGGSQVSNPAQTPQQQSLDYDIAALLDTLSSPMYRPIVTIFQLYQPTVRFESGLLSSTGFYGMTDGHRSNDGNTWQITIRIDSSGRARGIYAAGILAHELEHVWQIHNMLEIYVSDCTSVEAGAYLTEARVLAGLIASHGDPIGGLLGYEMAILEAYYDPDSSVRDQALRHIARNLNCTGRRETIGNSLPRTSFDAIMTE